MFKHTLYVGTQYDKDAKTVKNAAELIRLAKQQAAERFGGFSASEAQGGYIMKSTGQLVTETSLVLTIFISEGATLNGFAADMARLFNQESVLLEDNHGNGQFVGQGE